MMKYNNIKKLILLLTILPSYNSGIVYAAPETSTTTAAIASQQDANQNTTTIANQKPTKKLVQEKQTKTATKAHKQIKQHKNLSHKQYTPKKKPEDMVILNFEKAEIQSVIKAISQLSGKNFVIDPKVKGTVNIVSDKPISKADSYKVLEAALRMQGFSAVEADGVIKILPETDAKTYGMQTITTKNSSNKNQLGDQVITKIFVIPHGSAAQLSNSLRTLIPSNNSITVYPSANALIVTDYASNINRIGKIISRLSSAENTPRPTIVILKNSIAADVAQIIQNYQNGGSNSSSSSDGPNVTITVDSQNNSLVLYSVIKDKLEEIKSLALQIDKNSANNNSNLHVVYLRNADSAHVADVLRTIVSGQENPDIKSSSAISKFSSEPVSVLGGTTGGGDTSSSHSSSRSSSSSSRNSSSKDAPKILVQSEPTTNALIIQAPQSVYKNLRMIIDMIDVRRAQVMIEAMIADISNQTDGSLGIQWLAGGGGKNAGVVGLGNYGQGDQSLTGLLSTAGGAIAGASGSGGQTGAMNALSALASFPAQLEIGLITNTVSIAGQTIPTLSALANAVVANNVGTILSRPTLITLDNEQARIFVGQNVPLPSGSFTNSVGGSGTQTTITRQDLGTALQIKPLITQSGSIQLDIFEEDSQINQATASNTNGATYTKRNLRATILADDGQIIALGGLTSNTTAYVKNGIPLLSQIPLIGWLFSWQSRKQTQDTLVLFLRPVIVKNAEGLAALSNQRYNYVLDQQKSLNYKGNLALPNIKAATLDDLDPNNITESEIVNLKNLRGSNPLPNNINSPIVDKTYLPVVDLTNNGKNLETTDPKELGIATNNQIIVPYIAESSEIGTIE